MAKTIQLKDSDGNVYLKDNYTYQLYTGSDTGNDITLNDDVENYKCVDIVFHVTGHEAELYFTNRVYYPKEGKQFSLNCQGLMNSGTFRCYAETETFTKNGITRGSTRFINTYSATSEGSSTVITTWKFQITHVIGYK